MARLPNGTQVARLGQGTWRMGEGARPRSQEADALRLGIELGMTLIDTAEMYADGGAEEVVAAAIAGQRDRVFLVSKVYPQNATRAGVATACERSLRRLGTDRIDLYLLHWRASTPLAETVAGFEALRQAGKIRHWGVSNLDTDEMEELAALADGAACATDQVLYSLEARGPEVDLLPWCAGRAMPVMAYSPVGQAASGHAGPGRGRLDAAPGAHHQHSEGVGPRACPAECRGRRHHARRRGPGSPRRRLPAAARQAAAAHVVVFARGQSVWRVRVSSRP